MNNRRWRETTSTLSYVVSDQKPVNPPSRDSSGQAMCMQQLAAARAARRARTRSRSSRSMQSATVIGRPLFPPRILAARVCLNARPTPWGYEAHWVRAGRRRTGAWQHPCLPLLCRTPSGHVTDRLAVPSPRSTLALARLIIILCRDACDALTFLLLDSPLPRRCRCRPRRRSERDHFRL